jgi:putative DNA primase/helicase
MPATATAPPNTPRVPEELLGVDVTASLDAIAAGNGSHDALVRLAGRWAALGLPSGDAVAALTNALLRRPEDQRDTGWQKALADVPRIVSWAYEQEAASSAPSPPPPPTPPTPDAGPAPDADPQGPDLDLDGSPVPAYSDEHLALQFAEQHAERLRYVGELGQWLLWSGAAWQPDNTLRVFSRVRLLLRQAAASCKKRRLAPIITSARTVAAVERLARADRRLAATVDQWDIDPTTLNTPGGVVNLRTGQLRPHRSTDYLTRITAAAPGGACPAWCGFLVRITGGDQELQAFLQRIAGYCLTGSTREHVLFFAYGLGANGKSTFLNTLTGVLGSYATAAAMETFTHSQNDQHPCDLAMLRGARLVAAQETADGRRWAERRISAMSGGDPITCRFMRQNFFTYIPVFKLCIAGNHRPRLRSINEAIRRRVVLIPFAVTIPAAERDKALPQKLRAEWSGILAWAIQGCLDWQRVGLAPPAAVTAASEEYLTSEDLLATWISEACDVAVTAATYLDVLYSAFRAWCEQGNEFALTRRRFTSALEDRGFQQQRDRRRGAYQDHSYFAGLALKSRAGTVPP